MSSWITNLLWLGVIVKALKLGHDSYINQPVFTIDDCSSQKLFSVRMPPLINSRAMRGRGFYNTHSSKARANADAIPPARTCLVESLRYY